MLGIGVAAERLAPLVEMGARLICAEASVSGSTVDALASSRFALAVLGVSSQADVTATRTLSRRSPGTPILALVHDPALAIAAIRAGADYVLPGDVTDVFVRAVYVAVTGEVSTRLALVAHDINNPLQAILSGIEELATIAGGDAATPLDAEVQGLLEEMRTAAGRVREVTRTLAPPPLATEPPCSRTHSIAPARAPRVLVIDDEEALLRTYKRSLRGLDVETASGGAAALAILAADRSFDVILCDLMMPDVDGLAVHAYLAANAPALAERVVFCSGGVFTARAQAFLDRIPNRVLEKPVAASELRSAIEAAAAKAPAAVKKRGPNSVA